MIRWVIQTWFGAIITFCKILEQNYPDWIFGETILDNPRSRMGHLPFRNWRSSLLYPLQDTQSSQKGHYFQLGHLCSKGLYPKGPILSWKERERVLIYSEYIVLFCSLGWEKKMVGRDRQIDRLHKDTGRSPSWDPRPNEGILFTERNAQFHQ